CEEGAGQMGAVVFDEMDANAARLGQVFHGEPLRQARHLKGVFRTGEDTAPVTGLRERTRGLAPEVGARVPRDRDVLEITCTGAFETESCSRNWESCPVLDSVEAFFFYCGNELAISQQGRRSVTVKGIKTEDVHFEISRVANRPQDLIAITTMLFH